MIHVCVYVNARVCVCMCMSAYKLMLPTIRPRSIGDEVKVIKFISFVFVYAAFFSVVLHVDAVLLLAMLSLMAMRTLLLIMLYLLLW